MNQQLTAIRTQLEKHNAHAYLLPRTDPHQSEYIPEYWEILSWLSGFTGSAANATITQDHAGVWTDSRYFIQGEQQLADSGFELMRLSVPHTTEYADWLAQNLQPEQTVGLDGRLISRARFKQLERKLTAKQITINANLDLITDLWSNRPAFPSKIILELLDQYSGKTRIEKIATLRKQMHASNVTAHVISSLDDIAWLLNVRGSDTEFTPLPTSYLFLDGERIYWFIHQNRIPDALKKKLTEEGIELLPYDDIASFLKTLSGGSSVMIDPKRTSQWIVEAIPEDCTVVEAMNFTTASKSVKNDTEIRNIKEAMNRDGIALVKFLIWLEESIGKETITEFSAATKLEAFRQEQDDFVSPSFATIASYEENGAIVHYRPSEETALELHQQGLFLLDSGGQYLLGTTDITRTINLYSGTATAQEVRDFTLVLKGHIQLAMQQFPVGTKGYQLDVLARQALWNAGINYGHGTGHGVGYFLNVHEGPQSIGTGATANPNSAMKPGMLTSNEPGVYREGYYGIRIENLMITVEKETTEFGNFLGFETVSLCPIDQSLIDPTLLNLVEIEWLNDYHQKVYDRLRPNLNEKETTWLANQTNPIKI